MGKREEFDKLFVYKTPENAVSRKYHPLPPPGEKASTFEVFTVNNDIIKGAFRVICVWCLAPDPISEVYKPHIHNCDEILMYIGTNPEAPYDLGGEVEFWIEDEKYIITKSCSIYLPKGLQHAPTITRKVNRPFFHIVTVPAVGRDDINTYTRNTKWSEFKDPPKLDEVKWMD